MRFPSGEVSGRGRVQAVLVLPDAGDGPRWGVVVDVTPFHPLDHTWPDQPADTGTLGGLPVVDALTAAAGADGELLMGEQIPVRRGDPSLSWHVLHVVAPGAALPPEPGDEVDLEVDVARRTAISAGHTACHLAAFALNARTAHLWRKDVDRRDGLGNPDLDQLAITVSTVGEREAFDSYRLGKSLRKKGFDTAALLEDLPGIEAAVNATLAGWVASGAAVRVETGGDDVLTARRRWTCALPDGEASVPCGGSHVTSLAALGAVRVTYVAGEDGASFSVRTHVG